MQFFSEVSKQVMMILSTEMSLNIHRHSLNLYFFMSSDCVIANMSNNSDCHELWHYLRRNGYCYCGIGKHGVIFCDKQYIHVKQGICVTWDNATGSAEVHRCLFTKWSDNYTCTIHDVYRISTTATGEKLNNFTCGDYNRQGRYCSQCIDGYGPAVFSDDVICADCTKHRHLWILNLTFQIKGTSTPLNVIIMYAQLITMGLKFDRNLCA